MKKRGVVIANACDFQTIDGHTTVRCPFLDPDLIRTSVLYWDRMDIPDGDVIKVSLNSEFDVLIQEKILTRQAVKTATPLGFVMLDQLGQGNAKFSQDIIDNGNNSKLARAINQGPLKAFHALASEDNEVIWSYFSNNISNEKENDANVPYRALLFEIHQALPIPDCDTPIDQILEFKAKRANELLALRCEIDAVYQEISNATDMSHAKSMAFNKLELALSDLSKAANENLGCKLARSLKFEINPIGMASAAVALAAGSITTGALVAFGSCFKLDTSETVFNSSLPERLTPYKYVLDVQKELN